MIVLSQVPEKYPKLASAYEKESGHKAVLLNGNISKGFTHWIQNKKKYYSLICKDPNCPKFRQRFRSEVSLNWHNSWHNKKQVSLICKDPNCPKFGQEFESKLSLRSHKNFHNITIKPLNMGDDISKFFVKFLFKHSYFSTNTLIGIYHDTFHPQVDEHKSVRTKLKSLLRYHLKLGVLEKYGTRIYKVNKELLREHYGNGEDIGKT